MVNKIIATFLLLLVCVVGNAQTNTYNWLWLKDFTPGSFSDGFLWHDNNHMYARLGGVSYQIDQQGGITGTGSANRIPYWTSASTQSFGPYWDNSNTRLGIGATPSFTFDVSVSSGDNVGRFINTGSGEVDLVLSRTGGTVASWTTYIPSGSTDLRFYNSADRFVFTSGGLFKLLTAPTNDNAETSFLVRQSDGEIQTRAASSLGNISGTLTSGRIPFSTGTNTLSDEALFEYNSSDNILYSSGGFIAGATVTNGSTGTSFSKAGIATIDAGQDFLINTNGTSSDFNVTARNINLNASTSLLLPGLPTSNPSISNAVWNNGGTLVQGAAPFLYGSASLDFASTLPGTSSELTITVTGATSGKPCTVGTPSISSTANTMYSCRVSSSNTVSVKFNNYGAIAVDPSSGTFQVVVFNN